jgi:hypothetical protein
MCFSTSTYLWSIYGSTALCWALAAFSVSWSYTQSVGLLEGGISLSQGRYLHTEQRKHRMNEHRHPCLERDSNPRSQRSSERSQFMPTPRGHRDRCSVPQTVLITYTATDCKLKLRFTVDIDSELGWRVLSSGIQSPNMIHFSRC